MRNPRQAPSERPLWPRAEARPLNWCELTSTQKDVGRQILRLLQGMAHRDIVSDQSDLGRSLVQLERLRHNRVLLIEGSRGAGKTALLVTLLRALQRDAEALLQWDGTQIAPDPDWKTEGQQCLGDVLIVPVALIDLAPLPHRSNLLLLFVACLQRVVQRIEAKAGLPPAQTLAAWQPEANEQLPSRVAWERLASAIVQGWDGSGSQPGHAGDLESYARATLIAEEQRLELPNCIREFLRALSDDFRRHFMRHSGRSSGHPPEKELLFLLAVDDADMNPRRVSSLVDALRLFAHQRLAFVLTGDSQLFQRNLEYSSVAEQLINLGPGKLPIEQEVELWQSSQLLARQIYDKLIPTSQRRGVRRLSAIERLAFMLRSEAAEGVPTDSQQPDGASQSLRDLLEQLGFVSEVSLAQLLERMPWLGAALPGHLRALTDFMHLLREQRPGIGSTASPESPNSKKKKLSTEVPEFLWTVAWSEIGGLHSTSAKEVGSLRRIAGDTALRIEVCRLPQQLDWIPDVQGKGRLISPWQQYAPLKVRARFDRIEPGSQATTHEYWGAVAALLLSALLVEAQDTGQVRSEGAQTTEVTLPLAAGELQDLQASLNSGEPVRIPWPLPQHLPLVPQLILAFHWANCLAQEKADLVKSGGGDILDSEAQRRLLAQFVNVVCQQAEYAEDGRSHSSLFSAPSSEYSQALAALGGLLRRHSGETSRVAPAFRDWALHRVGLLAAPESGLAPELANAFLHDLRQKIGEDVWLPVRRQLAESRRLRLVHVLSHSQHRATETAEPAAKAHALKLQLDACAQGYDWRLVIEQGAEALLGRLAHRCGARLAPQTLDLLLHGSAAWSRALEEALAQDLPNVLARMQEAAYQPGAHDRPVSAAALGLAKETMLREHDIGNFDLASSDGTVEAALAATPSLLKDAAHAGYAGGEIAFRQLPGPLFPCRIARVRGSMFELGAEALPPLLRGLWHLEHDQMWFERRSDVIRRVVQTHSFPGVTMPVDVSGSMVALPWPTLRWPTFASAGRLAVQWNQALAQLVERVADTAGRPLLDALGFFYLSLSLAIAQGREELPELPVRPLLEKDWLHLLNDTELAHFPSDAKQSPAGGGEGIPLAELWAFLVIMASPETGLSTSAARGILLWLRDRDPDDSRHRRAFEEREQRLRTLPTLQPGGQASSGFVLELSKRIASVARELEHPTQLLIDALGTA